MRIVAQAKNNIEGVLGPTSEADTIYWIVDAYSGPLTGNNVTGRTSSGQQNYAPAAHITHSQNYFSTSEDRESPVCCACRQPIKGDYAVMDYNEQRALLHPDKKDGGVGGKCVERYVQDAYLQDSVGVANEDPRFGVVSVQELNLKRIPAWMDRMDVERH